MPKINKREIIEIGYQIFALKGPEHVEERVAQEVNLKRHEFHEQFGSEDTFIEQLLSHHIELVDDFLEDTEQCKSWDALLDLIVEYKITVLFNRQLKLHSSDPVFGLAFNRISYLIRAQAFDLWRKYTDLWQHHELSMELFEVLRDVFHSRITNENLNYEYLKSLTGEFRALIERLIKLEQNVLRGN